MTTVRVIVEVTKTYLVDVDPALYGETPDIPAQDLCGAIGDRGDGFELIRGYQEDDGQVSVEVQWRPPRYPWEKS